MISRHSLRKPTETVFEILDAPTDLRAFIPRVGERHDHVVVRLGYRGAMA
jgi:hypothetical protein